MDFNYFDEEYNMNKSRSKKYASSDHWQNILFFFFLTN